MNIETRLAKLERQTAAPFQHSIVVTFDDDRPPVQVSCNGETFTRKPGESYESFISRAAGNHEGVSVLFAVPDMPRPKHCRMDSIFQPDKYEA